MTRSGPSSCHDTHGRAAPGLGMANLAEVGKILHTQRGGSSQATPESPEDRRPAARRSSGDSGVACELPPLWVWRILPTSARFAIPKPGAARPWVSWHDEGPDRVITRLPAPRTCVRPQFC